MSSQRPSSSSLRDRRRVYSPAIASAMAAGSFLVSRRSSATLVLTYGFARVNPMGDVFDCFAYPVLGPATDGHREHDAVLFVQVRGKADHGALGHAVAVNGPKHLEVRERHGLPGVGHGFVEVPFGKQNPTFLWQRHGRQRHKPRPPHDALELADFHWHGYGPLHHWA